MHAIIVTLTLPRTDQPVTLDLAAVYAHFQTLPDLRKRRGIRYPLAVLLTIAVLAKLAGYSQARAIADWAQLRAAALATVFGLPRATMPHPTTWSRVFAHAVAVEALDTVVRSLRLADADATVPARASVVVALDGKPLHGTIPHGHSHGVHLLSAYHVEPGLPLAQQQVATKTTEISAAPELVDRLALAGMVVTGDALHAQQELSRQIVEAGGDYCWIVKQNQPRLLADVALLFTPLPLAAGESADPLDFTTARVVEQGHGRLETREITVSSLLAEYQGWPYLAQAFQVVRTLHHPPAREPEVRYGITSAPQTAATARQVLAMVRAHWGIENGLH
jgi:DDE_Tnp_1-associated/Transposase DDE domain